MSEQLELGAVGSARDPLAARKLRRERALERLLEAARRASESFRTECGSPWVSARQVAAVAGISVPRASGRLRVLAARGAVEREDWRGPSESGPLVSLYWARRP